MKLGGDGRVEYFDRRVIEDKSIFLFIQSCEEGIVFVRLFVWQDRPDIRPIACRNNASRFFVLHKPFVHPASSFHVDHKMENIS